MVDYGEAGDVLDCLCELAEREVGEVKSARQQT